MNYKSLSRIVRTMMMSGALTLLAALPASAQMVNETRPHSGTTVNPCNGETIVFSGTIHFHEKRQVAADGRMHYISNNSFHASGTGQATRATYNVSGSLQINSKFRTYPILYNQKTRFVSTNSAVPSFNSTYAFHVNGVGIQTQVTLVNDCN